MAERTRATEGEAGAGAAAPTNRGHAHAAGGHGAVAGAALTLAERDRIQRRTLRVVMAGQVLGGLGLAAGVSVGALLAQDVLGVDNLAGLPAALFTLGSAATAYLMGRSTARFGRRLGLGTGFAVGGVGAFGVVLGAVLGNAPLLFACLFLYGAGTATNLMARYAGADLASPERRGLSVSVAMVATTVGAVIGPNLVEPLGRLAGGLGLPPLTGPFLLSGTAFLAAGAVLVALLRPDPYLLARELAAHGVSGEAEAGDDDVPGGGVVSGGGDPSATLDDTAVADGAPGGDPRAAVADDDVTQRSGRTRAPEARPAPAAYLGATVMVLAQIAMVAIMTMTPVHMRAHGHDLGAVGFVISAHVAFMFLPSPLTGILVDRVGRGPLVVASGATLLAAGAVAALAPADSLGWLMAGLALLGLGWNFGLVSGTALVVDGTTVANRARTQGSIDVLIALSGAGAGAGSGVVMASTSYAALSVAGGVLALGAIPVLWWVTRRGARGAIRRGERTGSHRGT